MGKTNVGKNSKVISIADDNGLSIGLHVDGAQQHESVLAKPILATVKARQRRGRPCTRPGKLVADKACDGRAFR